MPPAFWLMVFLAVSVPPQPGDEGDERQRRQGDEHRANAGDDDPGTQEDEQDGQQERRQIPEISHNFWFLIFSAR